MDSTAKKLIALQEKWKSIGPVPDAQNDKVWKRFRGACDTFFKKREVVMKEKHGAEKENLSMKYDIIAKVEKLSEEEDGTKAFEELRNLQKAWMAIGFVPFKNKNDVQNKYKTAVDAIYNKFRQSAEENKALRMKEHYELLAGAPNGNDKMRYEERGILDKLRGLRENAETLKNNIEFFAKSKNADALKKQIEQKIQVANQQISRLEEELKVLRSFR